MSTPNAAPIVTSELPGFELAFPTLASHARPVRDARCQQRLDLFFFGREGSGGAVGY